MIFNFTHFTHFTGGRSFSIFTVCFSRVLQHPRSKPVYGIVTHITAFAFRSEPVSSAVRRPISSVGGEGITGLVRGISRL